MSTETNATALGLVIGQVWRYLPKAGLCGTRIIAMVEGRLHPTDETGANRCNDLEWFVKHAELVSSPPVSAPPPAQEAPACSHGHCYHCADCDIARAVAAQKLTKEAPKAAPVCRVRFSASGCFGKVADRVLTKAGKAVPCCETCLVAQDGQFARSKVIHQTGTPYAGPERLPRPTLAVDWTWECLPEAER